MDEIRPGMITAEVAAFLNRIADWENNSGLAPPDYAGGDWQSNAFNNDIFNLDFAALLTAYDSGTGLYGWTEQQPTPTNTWVDLSGGRFGTTTVTPAYETNGVVVDISVSPVVRMRRAYFDPTLGWTYSFEADGGQAEVDFSGAQVTQYAIANTISGAGGTIEYDTATYDTDSYWNPSSPTILTFPFDGWYRVTGFANWDVDLGSLPVEVSIFLDISGFAGEAFNDIRQWNPTTFPSGQPNNLATGDFYQTAGQTASIIAACLTSSGTTPTLILGGQTFWLTVQYLGDKPSTNPLTFETSGTWVAESTTATVECWGAGGGGGGNDFSLGRGGGGGGAGGYSIKALTGLTIGNTYTVTVGTGGAGGTTSSGGAGGESWFDTNTTVLAKGGGGGNMGVTGGNGGSAGSGIGDTTYSGGNGGNGYALGGTTGNGGGGGGGSGGTSASGNNGSASTSANGGQGGLAVVGGGTGGRGCANDGTQGSAGSYPGAGGGGAGSSSEGRDGNDGKVVISW